MIDDSSVLITLTYFKKWLEDKKFSEEMIERKLQAFFKHYSGKENDTTTEEELNEFYDYFHNNLLGEYITKNYPRDIRILNAGCENKSSEILLQAGYDVKDIDDKLSIIDETIGDKILIIAKGFDEDFIKKCAECKVHFVCAMSNNEIIENELETIEKRCKYSEETKIVKFDKLENGELIAFSDYEVVLDNAM